MSSIQDEPEVWEAPTSDYRVPPPSNPLAVELPAADVIPGVDTITGPRQLAHRGSLANAKYSIFPDESHSRPMDSPQINHHMSYRSSRSISDSARQSNTSVHTTSPHTSYEQSNWGQPPQPPPYGTHGGPQHSPPPIPPKTPLPYPNDHSPPRSQPDIRRHPAYRDSQSSLPYPDADGPPPAVNMARKPEFGVR